MRYRTELMERILMDETAQEMIDWVSQRYGESYVGLWLFQVIGTAFTKLKTTVTAMKTETSPATADKLLDQWEAHYALPVAPDLPKEARRTRILRELTLWGPCNPARMERTLAAMTGQSVQITENTAPFTFSVALSAGTEPVNLDRAAVWLQRIKPAHLQAVLANRSAVSLIVRTRCVWQIYSGRFSGTYPNTARHGELVAEPIFVKTADGNLVYQNPATGEIPAGTFPEIAVEGSVKGGTIHAVSSGQGTAYHGILCGNGLKFFQ